MSLANFYDYNKKEVVVPSLDIVGNFDLHNVPFTGGGGGGSGSVAGVVSYTNTSLQSVAGDQVLELGNIDTANTFGTTNLSAPYTGTTIRNTGTSSIFIIVSGYCVLTNTAGSVGSSYALWICKNNNNASDRYGYNETADDNDFISMNVSCSMQLAPNDFIQMYCWSNNAGVNACAGTFPGLRLTIAQLNEGSSGSVSENLTQCLAIGNDAGNTDIVNVGALQMNGYLSVGNNSTATSAQVHLNYSNGQNAQDSFQLVASSDNFACQQYNNVGLVHQSLQLIHDGSVQLGDTQSAIPYVYVTSSSGTLGRVYDSVYNVPPSSGGGLSEYAKSINFNYGSGTMTGNFATNLWAPILQFNLNGFPSNANHFKLLFNKSVLIEQSLSSAVTIWLYLTDSTATSYPSGADVSACPNPYVITLNDGSLSTFNNIQTIEFISPTPLQHGLQLVGYLANGSTNTYFTTLNGQCELIGYNATVSVLPTSNLP